MQSGWGGGVDSLQESCNQSPFIGPEIMATFGWGGRRSRTAPVLPDDVLKKYNFSRDTEYRYEYCYYYEDVLSRNRLIFQ